ncbi:Calcineurin-like phosphoesterase, partial [Globisporangium splendens]
MASKLNAFLAAVPANANGGGSGLPSPAGGRSKAPPPPVLQTTALFPELLLNAAPFEKASGKATVQPATPQPQMQKRRYASRRGKSFENHFCTYASARNLATSPVVDEASNQAEEVEDAGKSHPMTPLRAFDPKRNAATTKKSMDAGAESEAGPLRRLSAQGSHHRRVSTDTTMFNRHLRQQADRDITMDVVHHFSNVPVLTLRRSNRINPENDSDNNNNDDIDDDSGDLDDNFVIDPLSMLPIFQRGGVVSTAYALEILKQATDLMSLEQNVITIQAPYTLVGDLHGQFQDLLEIFQVHGTPSPENPFLFLGDYVDRGISSCEIVLLLLAFKVRFPSSVHLLRGNHECRSLSTFYGFRAECLQKYGTIVYNRTIKCFESMPLAAKLETSYGTFLAVHGGLSPEIVQLEDINENVDRFMEPEPTGALCDLLWADPAKDDDTADEGEHWAPNSIRGCSFTFNETACRAFLKRNELLAIIRAHELEEDGFREHFGRSGESQRKGKRSSATDDDGGEAVSSEDVMLPPVITVFSAPEYCNTNHNMGATLMVPWAKPTSGGSVLEYRQHTRSVHREHEFALPSEDQAVKTFLKETLPFLPVDFYELVKHCRRLRQLLMLSSQSSMTQLPLGNTSSSNGASASVGSELSSIAAFGLALSPSSGATTSRVETVSSNSSSSSGQNVHHPPQDDYLQRTTTETNPEPRQTSEHTTTEEQSTIDSGDLDNEQASISAHTSASRQQQQKNSKHEEILATTSTVVLHTLDKVDVHTVNTVTTPYVKSPRRSSRTRSSGWKLCPGFLRIFRRFFGAKEASIEEKATESAEESMTASLDGSLSHSTPSTPRMELVNSQLSLSDDVAAASTPSEASRTVVADANHASVVPTPVGPPQKGCDVFSKRQWQALKLYFTLLDISGNGVLMEESFVVLLAEQDSDAYATEEELTLLMEVIDTNADGLITEQDFLLFAHRSYLRWKKSNAPQL